MTSNSSIEPIDMVKTHCPICKIGDCSNLERCPLALLKWKNLYISLEDFAASQGAAALMPEGAGETKEASFDIDQKQPSLF